MTCQTHNPLSMTNKFLPLTGGGSWQLNCLNFTGFLIQAGTARFHPENGNWNSEMLINLSWSLKSRACKPNSCGGVLYSQVHGNAEKSGLQSEDWIRYGKTEDHMDWEQGREGEREEEKHQCATETHRLVASCMPPVGDLACNPGMCPDQESNLTTFGLQGDTQPTDPQQSGL